MKRVVERTAAATGVSARTINRIRNEEDIKNWFYEGGQSVKTPHDSEVPSSMAVLVRKIIRDMFLEKKLQPTIDSTYERIIELKVEDVENLNLFNGADIPITESPVWIWSRSTLYRFMKSIGFVYEDRISHYQHTRDREDIVKMRDDYLEWIEYYREQGYRIFFQDETLVFKNMTCSKVCQDILGEGTKDTFSVPSGKGMRSILCHIGSPETGSLENCMFLFKGSKSNKQADYRSEMNWHVFSNWREEGVFPQIAATKKKICSRSR